MVNNQRDQEQDSDVTNTVANPKLDATKTPKRALWKRILILGCWLGLIGVVVGAVAVVWALIHYRKDLPDYRQLADYEPSVVTRIHAGDGSLLTEFAKERRLFVPINAIPLQQIHAVISAEDKNFYDHIGIDFVGLAKAMLKNVANVATGKRLVGASTITQQVSRNFLLTLDRKMDRKIKEAILSLRIEKAYSKDRILELYLNEIYFGNRSYGIASAALNYFNKSLDELTLAESAYLAAIPKGPANYHPVRHKAKAIARRNYVIRRMLANGYIDQQQHDEAIAEDLIMTPRSNRAEFKAEYFAEEVRRRVKYLYGDKALYEGGLSVRTSLEPRIQAQAEIALRRGLIDYDRRHGWRGPVAMFELADDWIAQLGTVTKPLGIPAWQHAMVLEVRENGAIIGLKDGTFGFIAFSEIKWARAWREGEKLGPKVKDPGEVVEMGDVVAVEIISAEPVSLVQGYIDITGMDHIKFQRYGLRQVPAVEGALVALDPHTGRVVALVGGFDYKISQYNRATQAKRQPGSSFKPFVYSAALDNGFTPSSLVLDAPFVIDQGQGRGKWKPKNSSNKFYGPSTLRLGIEKSRNLMTVRLAQHLGMRKVMEYAERFGLSDNMEGTLAASLGAGEVTLMDLTAAYGMLVNGGKKIKPTVIDRIQNRRGKTVFPYQDTDQAMAACPGCKYDLGLDYKEPELPDMRSQVLGAQTSYQIVSMLQGVVENGTGRKIKVLNRPLAGKTGTTNDSFDAWFVGFSPDLTVGVFVGFDRPRSLGRFEEGSSVAAPIFRDFMREALKGQPEVPFRIPSGIRLVRVNAKNGMLASRGDKQVILEAFKPGTEPRPGQMAILDGSLNLGKKKIKTVATGTGGIY